MAAQIISTGNAVLRKPTASPWMMFGAAPVLDASAMP